MKFIVFLLFQFTFSFHLKKAHKTLLNERTLPQLNTTCPDINCDVCDIGNKSICITCKNPFFLYNTSCVEICFKGTVADNLRDKCTYPNSKKEIQFTKAYTIKRCKNFCGKVYDECSCESTCKLNGTCCSDYIEAQCDYINNNTNLCKNKTNEYCSSCDKENKCIQCKANFVLFNNSCVNKCPEGYVKDQHEAECIRKTCTDNPNCNECDSKGKCIKCNRGYFLYDSKCIDKCPKGYRADRTKWKCLSKEIYAWYWVYPSKSSCEGGCERMGEYGECSCFDECVQKGNCCSDYDPYCGDMI